MKHYTQKPLLFILLIVGLVIPLQAQAQDIQTNNLISVTSNSDAETDMGMTFSAEPGEIIKTEILVKNISFETQNVRVTKTKPEVGLLSINEWVNIEKEFQLFILEPTEEAIIPLTIQVPINAEPGDKSVNIVCTPINFSDEAIITNIGLGVKTNISLKISGKQNRSFQITEFSTPKFSEKGPINIILKLRNSGNVNTAISTHVTITNTFGKQIADWSIAKEQLLAEEERVFETEWSQKGGFGLYKADLILTNEMDDGILKQKLFFWIIPWKNILAITSFSILLIIIWYLFKKTKEKLKKIKVERNKFQ